MLSTKSICLEVSVKMFSLIYFFIFSLLSIRFSEADILIDLPDGAIRGQLLTTFTNKTYYSFQKVPYASPPIGELRFKPPVPPSRWDGILDASIPNRAVCYQISQDLPFETEDCLYLNIYTPQLPSGSENVALPVIFYMHGGGFVEGTCLDIICGPDFLLEYNVVVVTINYRLGAFGFLSTQDHVIPGNNGLKDQHLGIKWTKDNIKLFGGDPDRITIAGQSAGAASVTYQFLNPKSQGLFWGAICESGTFLNAWSFQRNAREIAFKTAAFINETFKSSTDSAELQKFLLSVSAAQLDRAAFQINQLETLENRQTNQGYFYAPVLEHEHEDAFITRKMYSDLKAGNFVKVPLMISITSEEALEDATNLTTLANNMKEYDKNLDWLVPNDLHITSTLKKRLIGNLIRHFYTHGSRFENNLAAGIKYSSDTALARSIIKHADIQSKFTDVYFYQFSYDGIMGDVPVVLEGADRAAHSEDIRYLWRIAFQGYDNTNVENFPEDDRITHDRVLTLWTNFAKTLNPTPEKIELLQNIQWPSVSAGRFYDFFYLDIDKNLTVKNHPKFASYLMWNIIYEVFGEGEFETY